MSTTRSVWKFEFTPSKGEIALQMPLGSQFLSLAVQPQGLVLYALCDPKAAKVERKALLVGTGAELSAETLARFDYALSLARSGLHLFLERELEATGVDAEGKVTYAPAKKAGK